MGTAQGPTFSDHLSQIPMGVSSRLPQGTPGNLLRKGPPPPRASHSPCCTLIPASRGPHHLHEQFPPPQAAVPGQNPNPRRGKWRRELWPLYKESGALTRHLENQTFTHNFHTEPGAPRIISFQIPSSSHFQLQGGGSGRGWGAR